jgi:H+/gluconate symporter-like permease
VVSDAPDADACQHLSASAWGSGFMLWFHDPSFRALSEDFSATKNDITLTLRIDQEIVEVVAQS